MILSYPLINTLFCAFNIERWNDRIRPMFMAEMDKHAHKLIIAYCIGRFEEKKGNSINWNIIFKDAIFELLRRVTISDIKSPIYQEIKKNKDVFYKLNEFVFNKLINIFENTPLKSDLYSFLFEEKSRSLLEFHIIDAAHIYSSFWEFNLVKNLNPIEHQNSKVELEIRQRLSQYYDLLCIDHLLNNHSIKNFVDLCGQLRFQIRWAQTPRLPRTSVLGHLLLVAIITYFISLNLNVCDKRLYNNFFGSLFHDLPEVVTRDIISPVKRSSVILDNLVSELEIQLVEKEIYPYLEEEWINEMKYFTQDEFKNKIIVDKKIQFINSTEELNLKYNQDSISPYDGEIVRFSDQYSAYLEAKKSIEVGISSNDLINAKNIIIEKYKNITFDKISISHLFTE